MNLEDIQTKLAGDFYKTKLTYGPSREMREAWRADERALVNQFRSDLSTVSGFVMNSDIESLIWNKAWQNGHADGLSAVFYEYQEYVEIARAAMIFVVPSLKGVLNKG